MQTKSAKEAIPVPVAEADKENIVELEKKVVELKDRISEVCTLKIIWGYSIIGLVGSPPDLIDQAGSFLITLGSIFENFILIHCVEKMNLNI